MGIERTAPFRVGDWLAEPALDQLARDGRVVKLEPRTMRLLCCLAERPGAVVSTEELLDKVWAGVVVGQSSVYQAVAQLRRALEDTGPEPRYVATVPRKGYRLVAAVVPVAESGAAAGASVAGAARGDVRASGSASAETPSAPDVNAALTSATTSRGTPPRLDADGASSRASADTTTSAGTTTHAGTTARTARTLRIASLAAVLLAIVGLAGYAWYGTRPAAKPATRAVVVLPFKDISEGGAESVFADGLTDEVITSLARLPGVRVTGRTSSFTLRDDARDLREIGRVLGVTHVLEGSVRSAGGRVRVSARLVGTDDGIQVWANAYDRPRAGAIVVQTEIARAVADALQVQLSPQAGERLARGPTSHVNAYELYLLGRYHQLQRTPEALERAAALHRQALEADPKFALARAGLADAYMAGYYYSNRPLDATAALVEPEVAAALALDPELAEAYAARAVLRTEQWRLDEAIADLRRAIAINPNAGEFHIRLGSAYEYAGRPRDALEAFDAAQTLDPLHTVLHVRRCLVLQNLGRYAPAEAACARAFELQPGIPNALWAKGLNGYAQGDLDAAIRSHGEALERAPHRADIRAERGLLLLDRGDVDAARREFEAGRALGAGGARYELPAAYVHVAAGERAQLERILREAPWLADATPAELVEAAGLALLAEDVALARTLVARATRRVDVERELRAGIYRVRWGRCELCTLAVFERLHGDAAAAERYATAARATLDELAAAGHRWHGLEYLRATLHAQRGDRNAALAALDVAVRLGWRRQWLTRVDPAFASLRDSPRFAALSKSAAPAQAERSATAGD